MFKVIELEDKSIAVVPHTWMNDPFVMWARYVSNYEATVQKCEAPPQRAKKRKVVVHRSTGQLK